MKRVSIVMCLLAVILLCAPQASATIFNLTDANSSLVVDTGSQAGAQDWFIDGINVLNQQWFWYRIGSTGPEHSIDTIDATPTETLLDPATLKITYTNSQLSVDILYALIGGTPGSRTSDVAETIRISNVGGTRLDLHFFQYSDFDLSPGGDRVQLSANHADQTPAGFGMMISETVITPQASHGEANIFSNTLDKLNDGSATTLNDVLTAGPGDATWAFQWDRSIAAGGSFIISKDKNIAPTVPEPTAIALLGGVLLLIARKLRTHVA